MGLRGTVRASTAAVVFLSVGLLLLTMLQPGAVASSPLTATDGSPLQVPDGPTVFRAAWRGLPVLVFKVPHSDLPEEGTPTVDVPGEQGLRLFAVSAKSTYLGCTVGYVPLHGPRYVSSDGIVPRLIMDPCHHGRWDPFRSGEPIPGGPAPARLPLLDAHFVDGVLVATGYDGPIGPQR